MTIVFVSNYLNHHQRSLCDALWTLTGGNFCFIQTRPMGQERKALGYTQEKLPEYVLSAWEGRDKCLDLVAQADAVIAGSAPEDLVRGRIKAGKLTFRYCERILKSGNQPLKYLPRLLRLHLANPAGKPIYLLCAGGYVASDFRKFGLFRNRAYRWGYFPETRLYSDFEKLLKEKKPNAILWAGRLIPWKHPQLAVEAAGILAAQGYSFTLDIVGTGPMATVLEKQIRSSGLQERVRLLGPMTPGQVRDHMEKARIFLCTSDRNEGWGAVINEAMNSGCVPVVSRKVGAAPYLLEENENGILFDSGNAVDLADKIKACLNDPQKCDAIGRRAYATIRDTWNPEVAAGRLVDLAERLQAGQIWPEIWENGPLSREG